MRTIALFFIGFVLVLVGPILFALLLLYRIAPLYIGLCIIWGQLVGFIAIPYIAEKWRAA